MDAQNNSDIVVHLANPHCAVSNIVLDYRRWKVKMADHDGCSFRDSLRGRFYSFPVLHKQSGRNRFTEHSCDIQSATTEKWQEVLNKKYIIESFYEK